MSDGIPVMWMRGGTSKGAFFLEKDLPSDLGQRDALLLRVMGSPDPRQIDGMGGGDTLTSKVAVVRQSQRADSDVEYLFLQVSVDKAIVTDSQNCGNILAGVAPFAIERGLVTPIDGNTEVRIFMQNTDQLAVASVHTPNGKVVYTGATQIDGVPGTAAQMALTFCETAGSTCGSLLPTGNMVDLINDVPCTLIDDGMPCVIIAASTLGLIGDETPEMLEADEGLKTRIEQIRTQAGPLMNIEDVSEKTIPKMTIVSPPLAGGTIKTQSFIPHRVHQAVGVFAAVTVGTAAMLPSGPAKDVARLQKERPISMDIEHPTGRFGLSVTCDEEGRASSVAVLRTARKILDGRVFV